MAWYRQGAWVTLALAILVVVEPASARSMSARNKPAFVYVPWKSLAAKGGRSVRLLEDSRVTRAGANRHGTVYFDRPDLLLARLELLDGAGKPIDSRSFDRPIADVSKWELGGPDEYFAVTVDYTCGMGSYCGPKTFVYRIANDRLTAVETFDRTLGKRKPIVLMTSLKTGWRRERSPDGNGWDIIEVVCRPTLTLFEILAELEAKREPKVEFVTAYVRHQFRDGEWVTDWTQRKRYTDVIEVSDIVRLPTRGGRDPYRENEGLSLGRPRLRLGATASRARAAVAL